MKVGDRVWLMEFDNGESIVPRERCEIVGISELPWGTSYTGRVAPSDPYDDGLREFTADQIEHVDQSLDLGARGAYWIARLTREYDIHVDPRYRFSVRRLSNAYGMTIPRSKLVLIDARVAAAAPELLDEMLVHELIHAAGIVGHGANFKKAYGQVYPWSKPGPVTEFDPGTPRKVLWARVKKECR